MRESKPTTRTLRTTWLPIEADTAIRRAALNCGKTRNAIAVELIEAGIAAKIAEGDPRFGKPTAQD